ncbi:MAG: hypothetical protein KAR40_08250 [Candidatus Sabulitectum sp.]|nr:hypothetical protein [Candidatus Sabulitectum sp.]
MITGNNPVELDRGIIYREPEKKAGKKPAKIPWPYMAGAIALLLIVILLFINPGDGEFIESPPPEEQAERDSIFSAAVRIEQYRDNSDSLPDPAEVSLPVDFTYEKEDALLWFIETESGLYYTSDMGIESFRRGEI